MEKTDKFVITINRELGSGGRTIGKKLADRLGVSFYDKAVIDALVDRFGLSVDAIEQLKGQKDRWWNSIDSMLMQDNFHDQLGLKTLLPTTDNMYKVESELLREIASKESCVIAGRLGFAILKDFENSFKIMIQSSMSERIARLMMKKDISADEAEQLIRKVDEHRENYVKKYTKTSRYDSRNYDLVLSVSRLTEDQAVDIILKVFGLQKG